jgi:hypothetical protein
MVLVVLGSTLCLNSARQIANQLVLGIGNVFPAQLNWLVVNNGGMATMDYTKPFKTIGAFIGGSFTQTPNNPIDWGAWSQYIVRCGMITFCGVVATVTVFIMEGLLLIQQAIVAISGPLVPMFVGCLMLPVAHGTAVSFFRNVAGVLMWPVGWAIGHIATVSMLMNLRPPNWAAGLEEIIAAGFALGLVCLCMLAVTTMAPGLIYLTVTKGANFAQHLVGGFASALGQHAGRGAQGAGAVGGALAGAMGGPAGALAGAQIGANIGGAMAMPINAMTGAAEMMNGGRHVISSSKSRALADAAVKQIIKRA